LPPKRFVTRARFTLSGTPTCHEDKRRCMVDVATAMPDAAGDATFIQRLKTAMLVTETSWSVRGNSANGISGANAATRVDCDGPFRCV
jgi:hypothetical protein